MNKSITMKTALAALACTACVSASAQKQYPEQEKMKPGCLNTGLRNRK